MKAIVVDDEWAAGQWLGLKLKETKDIQVTHILQNPLELMGCIRDTGAEVVFLDIAMPEITGLELAEQLSALEQPPEVVFVTAHNDYALEAFRVNALDYVVKPVHDRELQRVLAKLIKRLEKSDRAKQGKLAAGVESFFSIAAEKLDFPTAKSEELFFYLLIKGRRLISKWELVEELWPDKEPKKGETNLHTTVFRVNQVLENYGLDLRVKAAKGYYHFISASGKGKPVTVQPFPSPEALKERTESLAEILEYYNFLQLIAEKDYLWAVAAKEYETDYYRWAMEQIDEHRSQEGVCLRAFTYLLRYFPWQESLIIQSMPLIFKLQGSAALTQFYHEQKEIWETMYGIPLSKTIIQSYQNLIR